MSDRQPGYFESVPLGGLTNNDMPTSKTEWHRLMWMNPQAVSVSPVCNAPQPPGPYPVGVVKVEHDYRSPTGSSVTFTEPIDPNTGDYRPDGPAWPPELVTQALLRDILAELQRIRAILCQGAP